jgi:hypothetical protein
MDLDDFQLRIYESEEKRPSPETDVVIEISVDQLMVWIYENGGHITRKDRNKNIPFKDQNYDSQDDLIRDFTENVVFFLPRKRGNMKIVFEQLWGNKENLSPAAAFCLNGEKQKSRPRF